MVQKKYEGITTSALKKEIPEGARTNCPNSRLWYPIRNTQAHYGFVPFVIIMSELEVKNISNSFSTKANTGSWRPSWQLRTRFNLN